MGSSQNVRSMKNQQMRTETHKKTQKPFKHLSKTGDTTDTSWRTVGMSEIVNYPNENGYASTNYIFSNGKFPPRNIQRIDV